MSERRKHKVEQPSARKARVMKRGCKYLNCHGCWGSKNSSIKTCKRRVEKEKPEQLIPLNHNMLDSGTQSWILAISQHHAEDPSTNRCPVRRRDRHATRRGGHGGGS